MKTSRFFLLVFSTVLLALLGPACGSAPLLPEQALDRYVVEAYASSEEGRHYAAAMAFDGDFETRWASTFNDNEWIMARLGSFCRLSKVAIHWEAAHAVDYTVEASEDGSTWTELIRRTGWGGGVDEIQLAAPLRAGFVRITTSKRATGWGNSIFEVTLAGSPEAAAPATSLVGYEPEPTAWDRRCREIRDKLMARAQADPATSAGMTDDEFLELVSRRAFDFFWYETNPENGLTLDQAENFRSSERHKAASTANAGFALTAYAIAATRGWVTRDEAKERVRTTLRFFLSPAMKRVRGFYYHFVDLFTGELDGGTELSSIDSALLFSGVIVAAEEFKEDPEIVELAARILEEMDWKWMMGGHPHFPKHGADQNGRFLDAHWGSMTEGILCFLVGIGAPKNPMPAASWRALDRHLDTYEDYAFVGERGNQSIFRFQYPTLWYDFRNRHDGAMDYFENALEATLAMRHYSIAQERFFPGSYGPMLWGLGAANGPGDQYLIYGFPPGAPEAPPDGTVVIYAIAGSMPYVPELAIPALRHIYDNHREAWGKYGFTDSINVHKGSVTRRLVGLDQGTILLAIENHRTGYVWERFMRHPLVQRTTAAIGWSRTPAPDPATGPVDLTGAWRFKQGDGDFAKANLADGDWEAIIAPDRWENQNLGWRQYDGIAWYRREITLEAGRLAAWRGKPLVLHLGGVDDKDVAYVNGVRVGATEADGQYRTPRLYPIPAGLLKEGRNIVAIRVEDNGGFGGLWRRPLRIGPHVPHDWAPIGKDSLLRRR
jgi:hypothetical protein